MNKDAAQYIIDLEANGLRLERRADYWKREARETRRYYDRWYSRAYSRIERLEAEQREWLKYGAGSLAEADRAATMRQFRRDGGKLFKELLSGESDA